MKIKNTKFKYFIKKQVFVKIKLKCLVIFEAVAITFLLAALIYSHSNNLKIEKQFSKDEFLSPTINAGIIKSKSLLIVNFKPLRQKLQTYIRENKINASVYVENLRNGAFMGIDERAEFYPASLNKLPIVILIMKRVEEGELKLDQMLPIMDSDRVSTSGLLYKTSEKEIPLHVALEKMLKESDNTALRVLFRYINTDDLKLIFDYYGIELGVNPEGKQQDVTYVSPKVMFNLFSSLYFSTVLEPKNSDYILSLLTETIFNINKQANIPDNVRVAHKYGEHYIQNKRYFTACGIMYIDETRIFYCIMTKGINDEKKAIETIRFMVHEIYSYVNDTRAKLDTYKQ